MHSIFTKIFLWFLLAMSAVTVSLVVMTSLIGIKPVGQNWLLRTVEFYGQSATEVYQKQGEDELRRFLKDMNASIAIESTLLTPDGRDILGRGLPRGTYHLLDEARSEGTSQLQARARGWSGVAVVPTPQGKFFFVARLRPLKLLLLRFSPTSFLARMTILLLSAALLCLILARHIATPIRKLQTAAGRIADGDLTVRATPAVGRRSDELGQLARDFDRMAERIQSLLAKQQELLGDISHELRSPLARLSVSLELAERGDTDAFARMETDIARLDMLITQVLTLTRLRTRGEEKTDTVVDLKALLESVVEDAIIEGSKENKPVVITRADACWMVGDIALLRSCVENVLRNAVRYTDPGTDVQVSLRVDDRQLKTARLLVEDCGPGVPERALPRIFEPFYRVEESRDRKFGGSGLGLSIAQKAVVLHGGSISARNRITGGLAVEIRLPVAVTPVSEHPAPSGARSTS